MDFPNYPTTQPMLHLEFDITRCGRVFVCIPFDALQIIHKCHVVAQR